MATLKPTEAALAALVVTLLASEGWDMYHEVQVPTGGRADLVGLKGKAGLIVEVKARLSFEVLAQAIDRLPFAEYVTVAAPFSVGSKGWGFILRVCKDYGLGLIRVDDDSAAWVIQPEYQRLARVSERRGGRRYHRLYTIVKPEHKTHGEAGTNKGGYWTPYKATCREVLRCVTHEPGLSAKECIAVLKECHWASKSAAQTLISSVETGIVPGVKLTREGKRVRLWPVNHMIIEGNNHMIKEVSNGK